MSSDTNCATYILEVLAEELGLETEKPYMPKDFKGILTKEELEETLFNYYQVNFERKKLKTTKDLKKHFEKMDNGDFIILPYYAFQGIVRISNNPKMKRIHWLMIIKKNDNKIFIQSNSKAERLNVFKNVNFGDIVNSNQCLSKVKIDWGKYYRCKKEIPRKQYGKKPRCNKKICKITKRNSKECIKKCKLNGYFWAIKNKRV